MKPGDIVTLRSGGPMMTVEQCYLSPPPKVPNPAPPSATCVWLDKQGQPQRKTFALTSLKLESSS
jgi:uncharacterized protein YodC (DUF2158 family)